MRITHSGGQTAQGPADWFTGTVFMDAIRTPDEQSAIGSAHVGDDTLIGHGCTFTTINHAMDPDRRGDMVPAPVVVGRKVWFGASVTVVPGVTIGDGAVIGAGSVVTKDVEPDMIVAGVPARPIRPTGFRTTATDRADQNILLAVHASFSEVGGADLQQ